MKLTSKKVGLAAAMATLSALTLAACGSDPGADNAPEFVMSYVEAITGESADAKAAHDANPYSPILTGEEIAASAAGIPLELVEIGDFEEATEVLGKPGTEVAPQSSASAADDQDMTGWAGIDWSDGSWSGLETPAGKDQVSAAPKVTEGFVPVTFRLGQDEIVVPIGLAYGEVDGVPAYAYRTVGLTDDQRARFGLDAAPPAVLPAQIVLDVPEDYEEDVGFWGRLRGKEPEPTSRQADISGVQVTLGETEPFTLLPGVYKVSVAGAEDELFAPGEAEIETLTLLPGAETHVTLPEFQVTESGRQAIRDALQAIADEKFEALTSFVFSDRNQACGALVDWSTQFEDDALHTGNSTIDQGAVKVTATSSNGAAATGVGTQDPLARLAFCAGKASRDDFYGTVPVTVTDSALTSGVIEVHDDGTWGTVEPWVFTVQTTVESVDRYDAESTWQETPITTTYVGDVALEWAPSGVLLSDGTVEIEGLY